MIICFEGPDCSGKTTLVQEVEKICDKLGICNALAEPSISTRPDKPDRISSYELSLAIESMLNTDDIVYILDRGPISDCIYRLFDDYKPVLDIHKIISILEMYPQNFLLVYCHNDLSVANLMIRGDDNPIALEKARNIIYAYEMLIPFFRPKLKYIEYDFTKEPKGKTKRLIQSWLEWQFNK